MLTGVIQNLIYIYLSGRSRRGLSRLLESVRLALRDVVFAADGQVDHGRDAGTAGAVGTLGLDLSHFRPVGSVVQQGAAENTCRESALCLKRSRKKIIYLGGEGNSGGEVSLILPSLGVFSTSPSEDVFSDLLNENQKCNTCNVKTSHSMSVPLCDIAWGTACIPCYMYVGFFLLLLSLFSDDGSHESCVL